MLGLVGVNMEHIIVLKMVLGALIVLVERRGIFPGVGVPGCRG